MWEFHQIYSFGAVADKDELIRFWGQTSRSQRDVVHFSGEGIQYTSRRFAVEDCPVFFQNTDRQIAAFCRKSKTKLVSK